MRIKCIITLIVLSLIMSNSINAENKRNSYNKQSKNIAIEFRASIAGAPLAGIPEYKENFASSFAFETRYNFKNSPFDIGLSFDRMLIYRTEVESPGSIFNNSKNKYNGSGSISLIPGYHFLHRENLYAFTGVGLGYGWANLKSYNSIHGGSCLHAEARVGVELYKKVRFSISYSSNGEFNKAILFNVGICFFGK